MRIERLRISNFKSFNEDGVELNCHPQMNILVGENNVGKSNIFAAITKVKECLYQRGSPPWPGELDRNRGNTSAPITILAVLKPSESEARKLASIFLSPISAVSLETYGIFRDTITKELCQELEIGVSHQPGEGINYLPIRCGFLYLDGNSGLLQKRKLSSATVLEWQDCLKDHADQYSKGSPVWREKGLSLQDTIRRRFEGQSSGSFLIQFPVNVEERVRDIIAPKLKTFPDIRQRPPSDSASSVLESPDGRYLASVLLNLKDNTDMVLRSKYGQIREQFGKLFSGLTFESVTGPNVHFSDLHAPPYEVPVQAVGMGVVEILNFITNLMGFQEQIMLIDSPELHLHPHAQRLLAKILHSYKSNNQVLLITHSPYFVDPQNIACHHVVKLRDGHTEVKSVSKGYFTSEEENKLRRELLAPGSREIFFARVVLLVEGDTELGAMAIFAETLDKSFDKLGITVHSVGSKTNFPIYVKLLQAFDIPYLVMADSDWDSSRTDIPSESIYKLDSNFEGVLKEAGFEWLLEEAKRKVGNSKVRQGIYVAEEISSDKIPQPFKEVINRITEIARIAIGA